MIFLRQSLHVSAYEGIRVAIRNDTDATDVFNRCQQVLTERNIGSPSVVATPADTALVPRGQPIAVQVSAPCQSNSPLPLQFFGGQLTATATMIKE